MVMIGRKIKIKFLRDEVYKTMEKLGGEVIEIPYTKNVTASGIKEEIDAHLVLLLRCVFHLFVV